MEQTAASAIQKALTAVGNFKPKYPFMSPSKSALTYVAYHLKGKFDIVNFIIKAYNFGHLLLTASIGVIRPILYLLLFYIISNFGWVHL